MNDVYLRWAILLSTHVWDHLDDKLKQQKEIQASDLYWEELDKKDVSLDKVSLLISHP